MPILHSRTSEEATLRPLFGRSFIDGLSFPPLYPPSDADFVFSDIRGGHSAPVLLRAGPGVEPGTFGLEIWCSTTEPFRPPKFLTYSNNFPSKSGYFANIYIFSFEFKFDHLSYFIQSNKGKFLAFLVFPKLYPLWGGHHQKSFWRTSAGSRGRSM